MKSNSIFIITLIFFVLSCDNKKTNPLKKTLLNIEKRTNKGIKNRFIVDKYEREYDWSKIEKQLSDSEIKELINRIKPQFEYYFQRNFHRDTFIEKIHFVNLNGDDKIDLIFNGYSGGESDIIKFFIQKNSEFSKWFEIFQYPLDIKIKENRITEITTIDYGCCDSYMTTISKYKINEKEKLISETAFVNWTDMIGTYIKPIRFEIINKKYYLRDSPFIDNNKEHPRFDNKGNIIGELTKGQKGIAFKQEKDSIGTIWWLIETEPLDSLQHSYFYDNKIKTSYIGWISSNYVKTISN